jgi:hypothetical protein
MTVAVVLAIVNVMAAASAWCLPETTGKEDFLSFTNIFFNRFLIVCFLSLKDFAWVYWMLLVRSIDWWRKTTMSIALAISMKRP